MSSKKYNNKFNEDLSNNSDKFRTIMDIDGFVGKYGCIDTLLYDYKSQYDQTTINTLHTMSCLCDIELRDGRKISCFIVKEEEDRYNITKIKYPGRIAKHKSEYVDDTYTVFKDQVQLLYDFFKPELHQYTAEKLKQSKLF